MPKTYTVKHTVWNKLKKNITYTNRFSFDPPIGSLLWTWLMATASASASIAYSLTVSKGR